MRENKNDNACKTGERESSGVWWYTPLISVLGGKWQRQMEIGEFKDNLLYRVSSRTAKDTQKNPVSKNQNKK